MSRRREEGAWGGKDESRKLNDQRRGFVETKLAGGIAGDGRNWGGGCFDEQEMATNRQ